MKYFPNFYSMLPVLMVALCANTPADASSDDLIAARTFRCTLGHAINLDPSKDQTMADIRYEGSYSFALFLPASKRRNTPPPSATDPAEPVDPATRVLDDPAGLRRGVPEGFARVVDLWPDRVEMTQVIQGPLLHFIVINQIDTVAGSANLFMTTATDVAAMNLKTVYQGPCKIVTEGSSAVQ